MEESEVEDRDEIDNPLRERVITEVPIYIARKTNYFDEQSNFRSVGQMKSDFKMNEEENSEPRESKIKSEHPYKRASILEPIPII